ncbi:MAG: oxidoreductase [Clostridiales bacterium]|nr:oxidoreductase [Clostridiales bacterium]
MTDLVFAGFGGQGILTAGLIVARTGMEIGDNVTWMPSYGSEMRGGTANCNVRISQRKIPSPFVGQIDILVAMNVPSVEKFMPMLRPGGTLIVNGSMVRDIVFREDINIYSVPATEIADRLENAKGGNIVMLGALAASGKLYNSDILQKGMLDFFALKGYKNPKNFACFIEGEKACEKI